MHKLGGILLGLVIVVIGLTYGKLWYKSHFGPKFANVERKVFKETRSFNEAKIQELVNLNYEYTRKPNDRDAIASVVRNKFADYPKDSLSIELQNFLEECGL